MAIERVKLFVTLDTLDFVRVEIVEPSIYQNISADVGVRYPTLIYNPLLRLTANELRKNGVLVKLKVRTESGKSHAVLCNTRLLSTALPGIVGKTIPEQNGADVVFKKITKVSIPRKRSRL